MYRSGEITGDAKEDADMHKKRINKYLGEICTNIGIEPITTYWARHTVATKLFNAGITAEVISKLLGHSSLKTTDLYLGQLGLQKKREVEVNISNFMKEIRIE